MFEAANQEHNVEQQIYAVEFILFLSLRDDFFLSQDAADSVFKLRNVWF